MTSHNAFLELAATGIDFPLAGADRARLERHLAECTSCARSVSAIRADAALIAGMPKPRLAEGRSAELLATVLRPRGLEQPLRLLIAVALLGLLIAGALMAGARLLQREADPLVVVPSPPIATPAASAFAPASPIPSPSAPSPTAPALADHGILAVTRGDGSGATWIETVDLATGTVRKVADGSDPAWLGRFQLAYSCTQVGGDFSGICYIGLGDSKPSTVIQDASRPAPAPDYRRLAMLRGMVDVGRTWGAPVNADGLTLTHIAQGSFLRWSPDGSSLLGQPEGPTNQVAVVKADGTGMRVLATGYDPAWSTDGLSVAFAVVDAAGSSLRVVDVASGSATVRYQVSTPGEVHAPVWLPDGAIVFVVDGDLWRLDSGASAPTRLTSGLSVAADDMAGRPVLSPDGGHIAFTTGAGASARVGTASVTGGSALLELAAGAARQPAWAPAPATLGGGTRLGDAWTEGDVPMTPGRPISEIAAVAPAGGGFVAVGFGCVDDAPSCEAVVLNSRDGRSWERAPKQDATDIGLGRMMSGPSTGMLDVAAGSPGIVVVGYAARPDLRATAWFSTDGVTWSRTRLAETLDLRVNAVAWDGVRFVAVGEDRDAATDAAAIRTAHGRAAVWTSSDGRSWVRVTGSELAAGSLVDTLEDPASGGMVAIVGGANGLVGVGSTCTTARGCTGAIWHSADGSSWESVAVPAGAGVLQSVTATATGYVAMGPSVLLASPDGQKWVKSDPPVAADLKALVPIGDRLLISAEVDHSAPARLWVSGDATAWMPATVQGGVSPVEPRMDASRWRFGSNGSTAVWFAETDTRSGTSVWWSVASGG